MTPTSPPSKAQRVIPLPTLQFTLPGMETQRLRLEHDKATIGRRVDNSYVVPDASVSRVHASLERRGGAVIVTDLGSSGGTQVNGERISGPHVLSHGDRILFGSVACTFEDPATVASPEHDTMVLTLPEVKTGPRLSPRQQQVLELIAEGLTNIQIGEVLGITERTVKAYAQEVYDRLGVRNRAGAVSEALKQGLLPEG